MSHAISVVLPTLGRVSLNQALKSIAAQSGINLQILVIDDSQDQKVVYPKGLTGELIRTGGGIGVSKARNIGIECSKHSLIAFLDDDDEWLPEKTIYQIMLMKRDSLDASLTSAIVNGKVKRPIKLLERGKSPIQSIYSLPPLLRNKFYLPMGSLIYDAKNFHVRFREELKDRENLFFYEDLFLSGAKLSQTEKPLIKINYSKTSSLSRMNLNDELKWFELIERFPERIKLNFLIESMRNFVRKKDIVSATKMASFYFSHKLFGSQNS